MPPFWGEWCLGREKQSENESPFAYPFGGSKWAFAWGSALCEHSPFGQRVSFLPKLKVRNHASLVSLEVEHKHVTQATSVTLVKLPLRRDQSEGEMPHGIHFCQ